MSYIKYIEDRYDKELITLSALSECRRQYDLMSDEEKLTLDKAHDNSAVEVQLNLTKDEILIGDNVDTSKKTASQGWLVAGFVFAFLGGWLGIAIGCNYAFGAYKSETKTLGWVMILVGTISMGIWKSL